MVRLFLSTFKLKVTSHYWGVMTHYLYTLGALLQQIGRGAVYTLDWLPVYHRVDTNRQPFTLIFTPTRVSNYPNLHVFGLEEEHGAPGGNPLRLLNV